MPRSAAQLQFARPRRVVVRPRPRAFDLANSGLWNTARPEGLLRLDASRAMDPTMLAALPAEPVGDVSSQRDGIRIIHVRGVLFKYENFFTWLGLGTAYETIALEFSAALDDPAVRAILLDIDSPGGTGNGVSELADLIYRSRGKGKPIVAHSDGMMASAGYYIGAAADEVAVGSYAVVGSVGVMSEVVDNSEMLGKLGIKVHTIVAKQSPRKAIDIGTDEGRAEVQEIVDAMAAEFVSDLAKLRGVEEAKVLSDFGQGGVFVGQAAVRAGLADQRRTFEQTIGRIKRGRVASRINGSSTTAGDRSRGPVTQGGPSEMGLREKLTAAIWGIPVGGDDADDDEDRDDGFQPVASVAPAPARSVARAIPAAPQPAPAESAEMKELRELLATERADRIRDKEEAVRDQQAAAAAGFYLKMRDENRVEPQHEAEILKAHVAAQKHDAAAKDGDVRMLPIVEAAYRNRPSDDKTKPRMANKAMTTEEMAAFLVAENATVLNNAQGGAGYDPAKVAMSNNDTYLGPAKAAAERARTNGNGSGHGPAY